MTEKQTAKNSDFIEIKYTGYVNNQIFDSNIEGDLKLLDPKGKTKPQKTIIVLGEKMLVPGLDSQLEGKEIGKEYEFQIKTEDAFGPRERNLIRTIPLKAFIEQKINPQAGMVLTLDNALVKIIAVSGARVTADFNNPLAGKDLKYKVTISRIVTDNKEKAETLLTLFFRFTPEFEIKENKVIVKGPKILGQMIEIYKGPFKKLSGLDLDFEEKKETKKKESVEENKEETNSSEEKSL